MRETKFRVWDKILKQWLVYRPHPKWAVHLYYTQDGTNNSELQWCIDSDDFEVVQYNGLKDKHGVEIYEGDVVKLTAQRVYPGEYGGSFDRDYIGKVVVLPSKGACLSRPKVVEREPENRVWMCDYYKNIASYRTEIIGNIYENNVR